MSKDVSTEKVSPLPDLFDLIFILVLWFVLVLKADFLLSDGSTGWHLVTGNYILKNHIVPHADFLSYTFVGKPWVAYEWLADLTMSFLVKCGGLNLLNVFSGVFIALTMSLLYQKCRKAGCHFLLASTMAILGIIASSIHWLARPHLFTLFGVYLFSTMLDEFYVGRISGRKLLAITGFYTLIWTNCHPGVLFGFALFIIYLFAALVEYLSSNDHEKENCFRRLKVFLFSCLTLFALSFCNPYGFNLYLYVLKYLQGTNILSQTQEFSSPIFHGGLQSICLELLYAFFIVGLAITRRRLSLPQLLLSITFAYLSLSALRNIPLFVIISLPLTAQLFSKTIFAPEEGDAGLFSLLNLRTRKVLNYLRSLDTTFTEGELRCRMHLIPIGLFAFLVFVSLNDGKAFGQTIMHTTFDEAHKPTHTLTSIARLKLIPQQGFNYDNWGGYIAYQLGIPVFIDDRADFYGEKFYFEYVNVSRGLPGWDDILKKDNIRWILMPNDSLLVGTLNDSSDWKLVDKDDVASLYVFGTHKK
jgi:hypothetical protein